MYMMKVLFLTNIPSPYRVDFFNALGKLCDLTVLFENNAAKSRDSSWLENRIRSFNAVFLKGIRTGEAEGFCPEVVRFLSSKKYDQIVVGIYSSPTGMLAIEYMRLRHIPFILSSDGGLIKNDTGLRHWIKAHFISAANAWLSTGKLTTDYLCYYGAKKDRVFLYPFTSVNETDILKYPVTKDEKRELRLKLNMSEEKIVLSIGQFIPRKGYDVLLNKCRNLSRNIGVYIIGGKITEEYKQIMDTYNLTNVHFLDFMKKPKLVEYYKAADLFVLPTREDIWGLVINEAMSYGLPIITTDRCVAGLEMVRDSINGKIIPVESDWKSEIEKILSSENLNAISANNLTVAHKYSIENMATIHMQIFQEITRGKNEDWLYYIVS